MVGLLIVLITPLIQDATELKWNLKEGQEFTCSWKEEIKTATGDLTISFEVDANVVVGKTSAQGTACTLSLKKFHYKIHHGKKDLEINFENGVLKSANPESKSGRETQQFLTLPVQIRITPWGGHDLAEPHLSKIFFEGQPDCFGSHLPSNPVAVAGTWEGYLENPIVKMMKARPVKVNYKLAGRTPELARILLEDRQEVKHDRFTHELTTTAESTFNIKAGYCSAYSMNSTAVDVTTKRPSDDTFDIKSKMTFEMKEKK